MDLVDWSGGWMNLYQLIPEVSETLITIMPEKVT